MTPHEELLRRALLHGQAAVLLKKEVKRHLAKARRLRERAANFRTQNDEIFYPFPALQARLQ